MMHNNYFVENKEPQMEYCFIYDLQSRFNLI